MQNLMRIVIFAASLAMAGAAGYVLGIRHALEPAAQQEPPPQDNEELRRMHDEDQEARSPADPRTIDWSVVGEQDRARRNRVKALFAEDLLVTANDCYHAAMILQHGDAPEDYLLAHELAVAAIIKGKNDKAARWLAAAAEDRFLTNIGRPQRFATQFGSEQGGPWRLHPVDPGVSDELRKLMGARTLEEARAQEAKLNQPPESQKGREAQGSEEGQK